MIEFTLTDSVDSKTYYFYDAPFVDSEEGGEETVTTLSGNVYVDFIYTKRTFKRSFATMTEDEYLALKAFVDRQRTSFVFPTLTISEFGIQNLPVYLQISDRKTINSCGRVEDVELIMRETVQP